MEEWKDIPEYEGIYQVSNKGNVRSLSRELFNGVGVFKTKQREIKQQKTTKGYLSVGLSKFGKTKRFAVHQLVAMAFLGHEPCGYKIVVDHVNNNKTDNRVENIQLVSTRYNTSKSSIGTSKYTGVHFVSDRQKWRAQITINGKKKHLGYFMSEFDAYRVYENELRKL